jgi:hypothetical protein
MNKGIRFKKKQETHLAVPFTENVSEKTVSNKVITHLQL